jgi:hypothetical protein
MTKHQLIGRQVAHGSPGYEFPEIVASIEPHEYKGYLTINFKSGKFTHIPSDNFETFLEIGKTIYNRASGFFALEKICLNDCAQQR